MLIRAVVWKELREQGLIAATLAVLGIGLMIVAAILGDPPNTSASPADLLGQLGPGRLLAVMLVVTAGMVCGGALFAAEREAGTMTFLEALPASRWQLWQAKLAAGAVLCALLVALLAGATVALGLADVAFLTRLLIYAVLAFAWGAFGSTLARTTLGSVGIAIPTATLAMFVILLPISLLLSRGSSGMPRPVGWLLFQVLMVATPLALSAWRFTALDRLRAASEGFRGGADTAPAAGRREPKAGLGVRALVWLALQQLRVSGLVMSLFALAFGAALLLPEMRVIFVWPALALAAGVLAGVTAFGDEQAHRTGLFWGEYRLPIGRAWLVKIGVHILLLTWLLFLLALPCLIRAQFESGTRLAFGQTRLAIMFHSRLFDELGYQGWKYLTVPAVYGFAFGHLCGILFRKLVVACGVATMLAGATAALWVPSLLAGGIQHWQLWLPPAVALLTARLIIRSWAGDRATERVPLLRVAGGLITTLAVVAAGIGYRTLQIPDSPDGEDDIAFVAALPTYDENAGGREFRMATERFMRTGARFQEPARTADGRRRTRLEERLETALRFGWPPDDPELDHWLEQVYTHVPLEPAEPPWPALAAAAATRPLGVYDPPQLVNSLSATATAVDNARRMAHAILGRGLQQQAMGNPAAFASAFRTVVVLARTIRNGGGMIALEAGIEIERTALQAADQWLKHLPAGHAAESLAVARAAAAVDSPQPFDARSHLLADRFVIRGLMQGPSQWLSAIVAPAGSTPDLGAAEADLVAFAWAVPWERERTRRLVGHAPDLSGAGRLPALIGRPGGALLGARNRFMTDLADRDLSLRVLRRGLILKAAFRTHQSHFGKLPESLEEFERLGYLDALPEDPFAAGQSLRFRVSAGEVLRGPARAGAAGRAIEDAYLVPVQPGQVIIWSVGVDGQDQGGKVPPAGPRAEDIVFLVPPSYAPLPWAKLHSADP